MTTNHKLVCARAARDEYAGAFRAGICSYESSRCISAVCGRLFLAALPEPAALLVMKYVHDPAVALFAWDGVVELANSEVPSAGAPFRVMARQRPLLPGECKAGAYGCISREGTNNAIVVHDGRVHRDGRTLYMVHSRFCLDRVFGADDSNDAVYADAVRPLLLPVKNGVGGHSTLLFFGQTGTGKTYTASGVLEHVAAELFLEDGAVSASVLCYEIAGVRGGREAVFDLLAERNPVKCLTGENGQVHVCGARVVPCSSADQLRNAIADALKWRSSESTERNDASSRSHAIIELRVGFPGRPELSCGVLRVVDLAGSERNFETQMHTRQMAERGGHINYSLLMLKECARIMHLNRQRLEEGGPKAQHVPFRSSRLTHLLRCCFEDESHRTAVVATFSPCPVDVEHSLNTLQHVSMMRASRASGWRRPNPSASTVNTDALGSLAGQFSTVEGRGHGLHSKIQDARSGQLKLHAFHMVTKVGGTIMKRYEPENVKVEAFIDPRWHREMKVEADRDVWVVREADAEAVQLLSEWREEMWRSRRAHDVTRWDAAAVQAFVSALQLPGTVHLPSTMTGNQLARLSRRALCTLCSNEATGQALHEALLEERAAAREAGAATAERNARMTALGKHSVHVLSEGA